MNVNYPERLRGYKENDRSPPCSNWVYASYLPPGQH